MQSRRFRKPVLSWKSCLIVALLGQQAFADGRGSFVESFGDEGKTFIDLASMNTGLRHVLAITPLRQGGYESVVAVGGGQLAFLRLREDGSRDGRFGADGVVVKTFGPLIDPSALLFGDGTGLLGVATREGRAVFRFNAGGELEKIFEDNGVGMPNIADMPALYAPVRQKGSAAEIAREAASRVFFTKMLLKRQGVFSFVNDGYSPFGNKIAGIGTFSDGKYLVAGDVRAQVYDEKMKKIRGDEFDVAMMRFRADGELDPTFGTNGRLALDLGGAESVSSVLIDSKDRIVLAMSISDQPMLVRFEKSGLLDMTFGTEGISKVPFFDEAWSSAKLVAEPNGRILLVADRDVVDNSDFVVLEFYEDGSLNKRFGESGITVIHFNNNDVFPIATLIGGDRLIIAGTSGTGMGIAMLGLRDRAPHQGRNSNHRQKKPSQPIRREPCDKPTFVLGGSNENCSDNDCCVSVPVGVHGGAGR